MVYMLRHSKKFRVGFDEQYEYLNSNRMLVEEKKLIMEFVEEDICIKNTYKQLSSILLFVLVGVFFVLLNKLLIYQIVLYILGLGIMFLLYRKTKDNYIIANIAKKLTIDIYEDEIKKIYNR